MKTRPREAFSKISARKDLPDIDSLKRNNPNLWKKLISKFKIGRQIAVIQAANGLDKDNENILRGYFIEYVTRFLDYGPNSYPTSFNVLEPFFIFNSDNSILEIVDEEEAYGISLFDFVDFITDTDFDLDKINLFENIPEGTIYHFTFTTGVDEINFSNSKGKTFRIGGLSLVRQKNEVSMLMQAGASFNQKKANKYFKNRTRETLESSIHPSKKAMGLKLDEEGELGVIYYLEDKELWRHSIAALFDIESKSLDIRHIARDEGLTFSIVTDDFYATFFGNEELDDKALRKRILKTLKKLGKYNAVFDFAKYCLALPYYVFKHEDKLIDVTYETSLNSVIKGPLSKREFRHVPSKYKIFAKPYYYLESNSQLVIGKKELSDESFVIEKSGYWKRIENDEVGLDKQGRNIVGKTWVERNDVYFKNEVTVTEVSTNAQAIFTGENAGYIYIMRQPTNEENIFKVGLTKRSPELRKKELSNTSSVDKFFIINRYSVKDCVEAEKRIHKDLKKFRLTSRKEFFRCDLKIILDTCEKITNEINK